MKKCKDDNHIKIYETHRYNNANEAIRQFGYYTAREWKIIDNVLKITIRTQLYAITKEMNMHNCQLFRKEWLGRCFGKKYGKDVSVDNEPCKCYEFGGSEERLKEIENNMK